MEIQHNNTDPEKENGLDKWNDRLDENMESEEKADPEADSKAKEYSEENGSGYQPDDKQS